MSQVLTFAGDAALCQHSNGLARMVINALRQHDICRMSYHHMPPPGAFDHQPYISVMAVGYPAEWVEIYKDRQFYRVDPIPRHAMDACRPFLWSEAPTWKDLTSAEKDYLKELDRAELGEGLAVPVFGPHGRNGYVGLGLCDSFDYNDAEEVRLLHFVCQAAHLRYCELLAKALPKNAKLSERELEILGWIAQGKSNAVMADILELSPNTVDTYVRRIFRKLKVGDRVTAALRGLALGLIR